MSESTLTRLAPTEVQLDIPISPEEIRAAEERAFRKLSRNAKVPGFRPGKIPRRIFEQQYGGDVIHSRAIEDVVPEAFSRAVREHELAPVDRPKVEVIPSEDDGPLHLKVHVVVRPPIELLPYEGIALERQPVTVSDQDVERSLQSLARDQATLVPVDRPAQHGDFVVLDYEGKVEGEAFEGGRAEAQTVEVSEERFIPGFAAGVVGMRTGDVKDVRVTFPAAYPNAELAGKDAEFHIVVHEVKEMELPPLDDSFAQGVSSHKTLEELRADVRRRLEAIAENKTRKQLEQALTEKLLEMHDVPLPGIMVDREAQNLASDAQAFAGRLGLSWNDYLARAGKSEDEMQVELRKEAEQRVKAALLLAAIANAEKILATPGDIQRELAAMAERYGQPPQRIREALGNNVASLMEGIVRSKTIDWLIEHATITNPVDGA